MAESTLQLLGLAVGIAQENTCKPAGGEPEVRADATTCLDPSGPPCIFPHGASLQSAPAGVRKPPTPLLSLVALCRCLSELQIHHQRPLSAVAARFLTLGPLLDFPPVTLASIGEAEAATQCGAMWRGPELPGGGPDTGLVTRASARRTPSSPQPAPWPDSSLGRHPTWWPWSRQSSRTHISTCWDAEGISGPGHIDTDPGTGAHSDILMPGTLSPNEFRENILLPRKLWLNGMSSPVKKDNEAI